MARLVRLRVWVVLVLALSLVGGAARASDFLANPTPSDGVPATLVDAWAYTIRGFGPAPAAQVCGMIQAWIDESPGQSATDTAVVDGQAAYCTESVVANGQTTQDNPRFLDYRGSVATCSGPETIAIAADGGKYCRCNAGVENGHCGLPVPHSCPGAGTPIPHDPSYRYDAPGAVGGAVQAVCNGGCTEISDHVAGSGVNRYAYGNGTSTGQACGSNSSAGGAGPTDTAGAAPPSTAQPPESPPPATSQCTGATSCYGTVNGVVVCTACDSSGSTGQKTTTTTDSSGNTTSQQSQTTTTDNMDGTTTTTTTTTKSDGSTSTTTKTQPGGSGLGAAGGTSGTGTCVGSNCGGGGPADDSFGGSCATQFTCTGDVVQCAIAKEEHVRACLMYEPATQGGAWAHGAATLDQAKTDGDIPTWSPSHPSNANVTNFEWATTIDHSPSLPLQCPGDIQLVTNRVVLPLSRLCPYMAIIGNMIVAFAGVASLVILFKGKT